MRFAFAVSVLLFVASVISISDGRPDKMAVVAIGLKNKTPKDSTYPVKFVISVNNRTEESKVIKTIGDEDSTSFPASAANPSIDLYKQDTKSGNLESVLHEELAANQNCIYEISGPYDKSVVSKLCVPNYAPSIEH